MMTSDQVADYCRAVAKHHCERQVETDYTQGPGRWSGLDHGIWYPHLPPHGDCSSTTTWWFATARHHMRGSLGVDIVNGQRWQAGYTGTQIEHGAGHRDKHPGRWKQGRTLVFYGGPPDGMDPTHVVLWLGNIWWNPRLRDLDELRAEGVDVKIIAGKARLLNVVASHGQDSGPAIRAWDYRPVVQARAYPI